MPSIQRLRSGWRRAAVIPAGAALVCFGIVLARQKHNPAGVHAEEAGAYAPRESCARCHSGIAATYMQTGMSQSFHRIGSVAPVGDFVRRNTLYNQASDRHYIMIEKSGNFFEQRFQIGFEGKQTNREEMQIDYVVGSGDHARTFLHRTPEGKLIELPVSWYSERGGMWEMSPGYDDPHQQDFLRAIPYGCVSCHNAYPSLDSTVKTGPDGNVFPADLPEGIDCQRCHGPGEAHVEAAESGGNREAIRASIVSPARLSRDRQMDLCMQCHLETTSWPLPHSMRRFEHLPFSYQPGQPLEDYQLNFDHKAGTKYDGNFEVVHQAYQLRKSLCFQKSQMTCLTCHDPHQQLTGEAATQHYIAVCLRCHAQVHAAGIPGESKPSLASAPAGKPNCLTCHMWKRRTEDAVHVVMTDHDIQRYKPKTDMLAMPPHAEGYYRGEVVAYYPESLDHIPDGALYLDAAQIADDANLESGAERLRRDIEQSKPDAPEFYYALGTAYSKLGKPQEAIPWYQEALRRRPAYQQAIRALAGAFEGSGDLARAAKTGEKAAAEFPPDTATLIDLGSVYLKQGRLDDAKRELKQALAIDPNLSHAEVDLGLVAVREREMAEAESFFRQAIAITPDMAEPHNDLAILLVGRGNYAEAAYELARASAADPANAQIHRNYGAVLARLGMPTKAEGEFREAVRLAPSLAQPHVDLGNLLAKSGDSTQAEREYRSALALDSQDGMAHLGLAKLLAQRGAAEEAREHYEAAAKSANPSARQAAQDALRKSAR